jgi:uncharacterized coiled-coil DUF342 family protein
MSTAGTNTQNNIMKKAYRLAVKEIGREDYIISAVLHADERNKALSEQLGRDVFHYHLHVVYVPVVQKELYFKKNNKNPELAGKLKEVIPQISQANKWPRRVPVERDGKFYTVNSYSLLQDRYFEHMKAAGFEGFERGEKGSKTEHLEVLEYKIKMDTERAATAAALADEKEKELAALEKKAEKKAERVQKLDEQITVKEKAKATLAEVDKMGHSLPLVPGVHFTDDEAKRLKALAKKGVGIDKRAEEYQKKITALDGEIRDLNGQVKQWQQNYQSVVRDRDTWKANYERLWGEVKDFIKAIRSMPNRLLQFIAEHKADKTHNREVL